MIETEVYDDTDTREVHWDLRPVHFSDAGWQYGKVDIRRSDPYKIIITTERNDRGITGYVAIDDFEFKFNGEYCITEPEDAIPPTTTTSVSTTAPHGYFPDCNFNDNGICGWFIDEFTSMRWQIANSSFLSDVEEDDKPNNDKDGSFIYVNARNGNETSKTIFSTEMQNGTVEGCLFFDFSINVSASTYYKCITIIIQKFCFSAQRRNTVLKCVH